MELASQDSFTQAFEVAGGSVSPRICLCSPAGCERGVFIRSLHTVAVAPVPVLDTIPLVHIPASLVLTAAVASKSEIVCKCCGELPDTDATESVVLALFLLTERARGTDSPWKWYIDALPCSGSSALYFGTADMDALRATPLGLAAEAKMHQLQRQYGCFASTLNLWLHSYHPESTISIEDYKWASFIILSRAISLHSCDESAADYNSVAHPHGECDRALLPFLDMFNHHAQPSAYWTVDSDGSVAIHALAASTERFSTESHLPFSSEVFLSYGAKPATEWLYEYGFLPSDNMHDAWPFFVQLSGSPLLVAIKRMWIQKLGLSLRIMLNDPATNMSSGGKDQSYMPPSALLVLCLAALDDLSDECTHAVGVISPAMPYFSIDGSIIDDGDKLMQVPGLRYFAQHKCSAHLHRIASDMRTTSLSVSSNPSPPVLAYLRTQSSLVERIADHLTAHIT
ncbi:hypothetical protein H4R24_002063 [Coemansia sp. RSA 988]|nr:hypothetical protein H4R24_002063 [Coemansia sp. RSA 988]